ncbi:MAG: hypothetical protein U9N32_00585, partial [Spirochaetota bacterium]|nr:hypothetical protein [Spirochaetota bacterium]
MRIRKTVWARFIVLISLIVTFVFISCRSVPDPDDEDKQFIALKPETEKIAPQSVTADEQSIDPQNSVSESSDTMKAESYSQLSNRAIERIILDTIPGSFRPVTKDDGSIKIIYRDLDQNGYKDAFFLVVKNRENLNPNFSNLSDVSNLLKDDRMGVDFFLAVYLQLHSSMVSMYRIPIGSGDVISDFSILSLKKGEIIPLVINISFQTLKGTNSEWIIFSTYNKFSLFSMRENISIHSLFYDIDGNNIIDIIDWEDGLEEGTGYETYLTWYRWNGREFREYQTTNIVRNLN